VAWIATAPTNSDIPFRFSAIFEGEITLGAECFDRWIVHPFFGGVPTCLAIAILSQR
jgi:hypothetical protein